MHHSIQRQHGLKLRAHTRVWHCLLYHCCAVLSCTPQACLLVLQLLSSLPEQQQLAHKAHLPALSHLLVALRATLDAAGDPSTDMLQVCGADALFSIN